MTQVTPDFSIVIVTFNSSYEIDTLLGIVTADLPLGFHEVIVVDNASSDSTVEFVSPLTSISNFQLIELDVNVGFAAAANIGAARASGRNLVFLNPDALINMATIRSLIQRLEYDESIGCIGPVILNSIGSSQAGGGQFPNLMRVWFEALAVPDWLPSQRDSGIYLRASKARESDGLIMVDWVAGTSLVISRSLFFDVACFSTRWFLYCEDVDLGQKLRKLGYSNCLLADEYVRHQGGASSESPIQAALQGLASLRDYYVSESGPRTAARISFNFATRLWALRIRMRRRC